MQQAPSIMTVRNVRKALGATILAAGLLAVTAGGALAAPADAPAPAQAPQRVVKKLRPSETPVVNLTFPVLMSDGSLLFSPDDALRNSDLFKDTPLPAYRLYLFRQMDELGTVVQPKVGGLNG